MARVDVQLLKNVGTGRPLPRHHLIRLQFEEHLRQIQACLLRVLLPNTVLDSRAPRRAETQGVQAAVRCGELVEKEQLGHLSHLLVALLLDNQTVLEGCSPVHTMLLQPLLVEEAIDGLAMQVLNNDVEVV